MEVRGRAGRSSGVFLGLLSGRRATLTEQMSPSHRGAFAGNPAGAGVQSVSGAGAKCTGLLRCPRCPRTPSPRRGPCGRETQKRPQTRAALGWGWGTTPGAARTTQQEHSKDPRSECFLISGTRLDGRGLTETQDSIPRPGLQGGAHSLPLGPGGEGRGAEGGTAGTRVMSLRDTSHPGCPARAGWGPLQNRGQPDQGVLG